MRPTSAMVTQAMITMRQITMAIVTIICGHHFPLVSKRHSTTGLLISQACADSDALNYITNLSNLSPTTTMDSLYILPGELTTALQMSLACDELPPAYTPELPDLPPKNKASFLTLPNELRQQILKITFCNCIPEDLVSNLYRLAVDSDYSYITDTEHAKTGARTISIRRNLAVLMKACPEAADDSIYCAINARNRYLELFKITMEIWDILKAERGNTLTLGNLSRYIKTEGLLTCINDVPRIKERFRLCH